MQELVHKILTERGPDPRHGRKLHGGAIAARASRPYPAHRPISRCGVVSYSNESKVKLLGVNPADIERYGAVSEQVARQMAEGARRAADADHAPTGIAGPTGGSAENPSARSGSPSARPSARSPCSNNAEPTAGRSTTAPGPLPSACCATASTENRGSDEILTPRTE